MKGSFGFHLSSLSLLTTNDHREEQTDNTNTTKNADQQSVFKIAKMSEMGIFITPEGTDGQMRHILEPLTMVSHIKHILHAAKREEKGTAELTIDDLKLSRAVQVCGASKS